MCLYDHYNQSEPELSPEVITFQSSRIKLTLYKASIVSCGEGDILSKDNILKNKKVWPHAVWKSSEIQW